MSLAAKVSSSPLVHVLIAAFIGGLLPVVEPAVRAGSVNALTVHTVSIALFAGLAAALRALVLLVPSKAPAAPAAPAAPPAAPPTA